MPLRGNLHGAFIWMCKKACSSCSTRHGTAATPSIQRTRHNTMTHRRTRTRVHACTQTSVRATRACSGRGPTHLRRTQGKREREKKRGGNLVAWHQDRLFHRSRPRRVADTPPTCVLCLTLNIPVHACQLVPTSFHGRSFFPHPCSYRGFCPSDGRDKSNSPVPTCYQPLVVIERRQAIDVS